MKHDRKDWDALKREFLLSQYVRVADFLRSKDIPDSGNTRVATKGWATERRGFRTEVERRTQDAVKQRVVETQVMVLDRHKKIWKGVEHQALKYLEAARKAGKALPIDVLEKVARTLKIATEGERLANGMSTNRTESVQEGGKSFDTLVAQLQRDRGLTPAPKDAEVLEIAPPQVLSSEPSPATDAPLDVEEDVPLTDATDGAV